MKCVKCLEEEQLHGEVVSSTPGRLRVRLSPHHRDPLKMRRIREYLVSLPGIGPVEANAGTGSILIWYPANECSREEVLALCGEAGIALGGPIGRVTGRVTLSVQHEERSATGDPTGGLRPRTSGWHTRPREALRLLAHGARVARAVHLGIEIARAPGPSALWHAVELFL